MLLAHGWAGIPIRSKSIRFQLPCKLECLSPIAPAQQIATSLSNLSASKPIQPSVQSKPCIQKSLRQEGNHLLCMSLYPAPILILPWLPVTTTNTLGYGEHHCPQAWLKLPKSLSPLGQQWWLYFSNRNVIRRLKENDKNSTKPIENSELLMNYPSTNVWS